MGIKERVQVDPQFLKEAFDLKMFSQSFETKFLRWPQEYLVAPSTLNTYACQSIKLIQGKPSTLSF